MLSIKSSLKYSTIEGCFWALMFGFGQNYLSALAVFLGYTALQISVLTSFPLFIGSCFQLFSSRLLKAFKSTKKIVVYLSYLQSFLWIGLIAILYLKMGFEALLLWFIIYFIIDSLISPVWTSWMGYLVPKSRRGKYHGNRNQIINTFVLISILLGGFILRIYENQLLFAFLLLFTISFFGRFLSSFFLNKKDDILKIDKENNNSFIFFIKNSKTFGFLIFKSAIHFAVMFLGPLFTIYILRTLNLGNFILSLCTVAWWIANVISAKHWGSFSKNYGNPLILQITTTILTVLPLMWISIYYTNGIFQIILILIINLFAGSTFAGFSLASFNIVYDLVNSDDVIKYTSLIHFGEGIAIVTGSILAGSIVDSIYINNLLSNVNFLPIQLSMLISTLLRFLCLFYFLNFQKKLILK